MRLTLFDLDGTLVTRDTEAEWVRLLGRRGFADPTPFAAFHAGYLAGTLDPDAYYRWYAGLFTALEPATVAALRDELVAAIMLPSVRAEARGWIADARERGDTCLLVTASNHLLTAPIGAALGLDDVLATRLELDGERFTGRVLGEPCLGAAKLAHLDRWLAVRGLARADLSSSRAYSDSAYDLPLLEAVDHPIAVAPDAALRAEALRRGWPVLVPDGAPPG